MLSALAAKELLSLLVSLNRELPLLPLEIIPEVANVDAVVVCCALLVLVAVVRGEQLNFVLLSFQFGVLLLLLFPEVTDRGEAEDASMSSSDMLPETPNWNLNGFFDVSSPLQILEVSEVLIDSSVPALCCTRRKTKEKIKKK